MPRPPRNPKLNFDRLQMYFREPYIIDLPDVPGTVTVRVPTIGEIIKLGERKFYQTLNIFITNTTQYRALLWDLNIDWNTFTDFQLFIMFHSQIDPECASVLFDNLDFRKFVPLIKQMPDSDDEEYILWDDEDQIEINYDVWNHFHQYIQEMFNSHPEEKITEDQTLKRWFITKDKRAIEQRKKDEENGKVKEEMSIINIISSCVNHPGFKYKSNELKEVGVCEFYDSVKRLQVYEQSTALMKGMYSGFIDGSKIKSDDYNFMREV